MKHILLLVLLFTCSAVSAQQPDSLLNRLTGHWVLEGTIDGQKTTHDVDVQRVLGGQYVQLKEVSREKDPKGNPAYEATVYICWEEKKQQYSCLWLDNTSNGGLSNGIIGRAKKSSDRLAFVFRYSDTVQFFTTFLYHGNSDSWTWTMDEDDNGKMQSFARVELRRK
jgi:hypothetical protein